MPLVICKKTDASLFRADNERKKLKFISILTLMIGVDEMEWIERLNQAIAYIEEHLKDDIDYEQLGKTTAVLHIIFRE